MQAIDKETLREQLVTERNKRKQLDHEVDVLKCLIDLAWIIICEAGYEGHSSELNKYMNK